MKINSLYSLPHFNERPAGSAIDTIVIHTMYHPDVPDRYATSQCVARLHERKVSAHYAISQDGEVFSLVEEVYRAWHAGVSQMPFHDDSRAQVNDFSIGIELIGNPDEGFTAQQYDALVKLVSEICTRHPIKNVVGHDHIAPVRKTDPGPLFDWRELMRQLPGSLRGPTS